MNQDQNTNLVKSLFSKFFWIAILFFSRMGVLPVNFSILGIFGFFSQDILTYFLAIFIFDIFNQGFYQGFYFTYLGFFSYYLLGSWSRMIMQQNKHSMIHQNIAGLILIPMSSFLFFLISNLGSWWYWYPRDLTGLVSCYTLAIPFYQNTLVSDLLFGYAYLFTHHYIARIAYKLKNNWRKFKYENSCY